MVTYTEIGNVNITGFDEIIVYVATAVPIFIPAMLIAVFIMFTFAIYFGTRKFSGQADFWSAASAGGFVTTVIGTIFTFTAGIINKYTLSILTILFILSFVFLLPKRNRD